MSVHLRLASILIAAPVGLWFAHAAVSRMLRRFRPLPPQIVALGTAAAGNLPVAYLAWWAVLRDLSASPVEVLCGFAYVLLTYNACCYGYFCVLNLTETSLHVNILMRLQAGGGASTELARAYGTDEMIRSRIDRMVALGQLQEKDGFYFVRNRTLVIVGSIINLWRRVLALPLTPE